MKAVNYLIHDRLILFKTVRRAETHDKESLASLLQKPKFKNTL
jgi:hypothetical protein